MLNLDQVNTFVAIVEAASFQAASARLTLAPPTVSQHVRKLEQALGRQLLHRSRSECRLTEEGALFLPHARAMLATERRARDAIATQSLGIGASSNIAAYHLPGLLKRFAQLLAPENRPMVQVSVGPNAELHDQARSGQIDIALVEWAQKREGMICLPWVRERMLVIVPPGHPWTQRREVSPELLLRTPMVVGEPGTGTAALLRQTFGSLANEIIATASLGSTEGVKRAVMAGLGVSLVMESAITLEAEQGWLVPVSLSGARLEKTLHAVLAMQAVNRGMPARFLRDALGLAPRRAATCPLDQ